MPTSRRNDPQLVLTQLLRDTRESVGLSQADLAEALELRQTDISKIERGVRKIDVMELRRWAIVVGDTFESFARQLDEQWTRMEQNKRRLEAARRTEG